MRDQGRDDLEALIAATIRRYVAPEARLVKIASESIDAGMSEAAISRHHVTFNAPSGFGTVSLVTKQAGLIERRVLALLRDQHQPSVPFNVAYDLESEAPAPVCMEDLGEMHRPTSLDPIKPSVLQTEAVALAQIHHANSKGTEPLAWLPRADGSYVREHLAEFWEPAWGRAMENSGFRHEFGWAIPLVEAAAARAPDEIEALTADTNCLSLLHGDINPSNVLIRDGRLYFIDWQAACYGPFYLDVPHHFHTPQMAEVYRLARVRLGDEIPREEFFRGYTIAARYIGLRYIWWTLDLWPEDPHEARPWVQHYLNLITGRFAVSR